MFKTPFTLFLLLLLTCSVSHAKIVMLQWEPSPTNDRPIYYEVHVSEGQPLPVTAEWTHDAGPELGATFTGLSEDISYHFAVIAYDDHGNKSIRSNEVVAWSNIGPPSTMITITYFDTVIIR